MMDDSILQQSLTKSNSLTRIFSLSYFNQPFAEVIPGEWLRERPQPVPVVL